jgi:hypothetical protein
MGAPSPVIDMDRLPNADDMPECIIGIDMDELPNEDELANTDDDVPERVIAADESRDVPP